jgi:anhydro-N-acetylmuramic acid kinase
MNNWIDILHRIAGKQSRIVIGLMSGTSMDGLDIALCEIEGNGISSSVRLIDFETLPYDEQWRARLEAVSSPEAIKSNSLCKINAMLGRHFANMIHQFLDSRNLNSKDIDLIGSHGHTFFHSPADHSITGDVSSTFQIGDADHIALHTGIITVSDFRQKHIAAGGEGAPLAPYGDVMLFGESEKDVILLNIGGIANFSFIPARNHPGDLIFGDTGPGNCLMDVWIKKHLPDADYDKDALWAKKGNVSSSLLQQLLSEPFFQRSFPKSTGRELFNMELVLSAMNKTNNDNLNWTDILATLNAFTADSIVASLRKLIRDHLPTQVYITGGGKHNPLLIERISLALEKENVKFRNSMDKGLPSDAKEAVIFALLANEAVTGNLAEWTKAYEPLLSAGMGKISFPG